MSDGISRRLFDTFYGDLAGVVASQWGEDVGVTLDDKLHMSEQTTVQTVSGPVNFATTSSHTFTGPVNFSSTIITPNSNNLASLVTGEVTQLLNIGTVTISAGQWGYVGAMDQDMYQTSSVTFAGVDLVNNVTEFSTDTTLGGNSDTAVPSEKAVKTYSDLKALWDSDNSAITRYWSIGCRGIQACYPYTGTWVLDTTNNWMEHTDAAGTIHIPLHFPHGATLVTVRATGQLSHGSDTCLITVQRRTQSSGAQQGLGGPFLTVTMQENSDNLGSEVVDNDTYSYHVEIASGMTNGTENRVRAVQVDYTITKPHT